ncbi:hypothetical protein [Corynebacterium sp. 335C]
MTWWEELGEETARGTDAAGPSADDPSAGAAAEGAADADDTAASSADAAPAADDADGRDAVVTHHAEPGDHPDPDAPAQPAADPWAAFRAEGAARDAADAAPPIAPRMPTFPPQPVPSELPELLAFSSHAGRNLDHVSSWRAVSAFARDHWLSTAADLAEWPEYADGTGRMADLAGEYHALRHAVADQLELPDEAAEARRDWLDWAIRENRPAAALHARAFGAFADAERWIDAHPFPMRPADHDIPQVVSVARDILDLRPQGRDAYRYALSAAITAASASMARRPDLASALAEWTATYAPRRSSDDDRRLLEAQIAHGRGDLAGAARICAEVAEEPRSEPVTSTVEARQVLAHLSLEAGEEAEAIRQLRPVVEAGLALDLTVATLRSARMLTALLNARGDFAEAAGIARRALAHASGMPVNPLVMDIRLILARSLLDSGEDRRALSHAVPVAQWSTFTDDEERTAAAFTIASSAAARVGDVAQARDLLVQHADHLERLGDPAGASAALRNAARTLVTAATAAAVRTVEESRDDAPIDADPDASPDPGRAIAAAGEEAEDLMVRARGLITDGWSIADWHDDLAYIYWATGREDLALGHVDTAAAGYLESGDGEEAARTLLTGVRCCLDRDDLAGAARYTARIDELLPIDQWDEHPVRDALSQILG